jgi:hypothetical protein
MSTGIKIKRVLAAVLVLGACAAAAPAANHARVGGAVLAMTVEPGGGGH